MTSKNTFNADMELSLKEVAVIKSELALPIVSKFNSYSRSIRESMVKEAISFPKGPRQSERKTTILYEFEDYLIGVEKPGKEAATDYTGTRDHLTQKEGNNPNDMLPVIIFKGAKREKNLTFSDIFGDIESLMHSNLAALEVIGMLFFRMAYCLQHKEQTKDIYRLAFSEDLWSVINSKIPYISDVPTKVYIHYIDVLALNEDVKYHTLNYNPELKQDYGRPNTLLTLTNLVAVLLNKKSIADFAGSFARPPRGISAIQKTKITEYFPLLLPQTR